MRLAERIYQSERAFLRNTTNAEWLKSNKAAIDDHYLVENIERGKITSITLGGLGIYNG